MDVWDPVGHRTICPDACALVLVLGSILVIVSFVSTALEGVGTALQNLQPGNVRLMEIGIFIL